MINPKISIITVSLNSARTIENTIRSVSSQVYRNIEYLIVDGGSSDGTKEIAEKHRSSINVFVSEPDEGLYDAINKGIRMATGDIVGILNSDDVFYNDSVLQNIAAGFRDEDPDAVYGDAIFVAPDNPGKFVRYYSSAGFTLKKFRYGLMPAHPGFYAKRDLFEKYGYYKTGYRIAADYEMLLRLMYKKGIRTKYLNFPVVKMLPGGVSTKNIFSNIKLNNEIIRACRENGLRTNLFMVYSKYLRKVFQYINVRKKSGAD